LNGKEVFPVEMIISAIAGKFLKGELGYQSIRVSGSGNQESRLSGCKSQMNRECRTEIAECRTLKKEDK